MDNLTLWVVFDALLFYLMIFPFYLSLKISQHRMCFRFKYHLELLLLLGCVVFCIYNKTEGDYFHYKEYINEINASRIKVNSFEIPYMWIISIIGNNYFLFRLLVWGVALLIYVQILKLTRLYNNISISIFILYVLLSVAYTRASLALSMCFWGISYSCINYENRRYLRLFVGITLLFLSILFHKSLFVPVFIAIVLIFIQLNKTRILFMLFILPFSVVLLSELLPEILLVQIDLSQLKRGIYYLSIEREPLGISMIIPLILSFPSIIFPVFVIGKTIYSNQQSTIPCYVRKFYDISIVLILLSFGLLFIDTGGRYLYLRIKEMSYIPFSIVLSYYLIYLKPSVKIVIISIMSIFIQISFYFVYAYYLKNIGSGI